MKRICFLACMLLAIAMIVIVKYHSLVTGLVVTLVILSVVSIVHDINIIRKHLKGKR